MLGPSRVRLKPERTTELRSAKETGVDFRVVGLLGLGVAIAVCLVALVRIGAGQLRRRNGGTVTVNGVTTAC